MIFLKTTDYKKLLVLNDLDEFCRTNNIFIHVNNKLTTKVKGFCIVLGDEYYVYLNGKCGFLQLKLSLMHELIHVFENHFEMGGMQSCEEDVKRILGELRNELKEYMIY